MVQPPVSSSVPGIGLPPAAQSALAQGGCAFGPGFVPERATSGPSSWVVLEAPMPVAAVAAMADRADIAHGWATLNAAVRDLAPNEGIFGYLAYEMGGFFADGVRLHPSPAALPLLWAVKSDAILTVPAPDLAPGPAPLAPLPDDPARREVFEGQVDQVKAHIAAGDIFQANLSQLFRAQAGSAPVALFSRLLSGGAAPYASCLQLPGGAVLSNSPELFLKIADGRVIAEPIKGTRPRGASPDADEALATDLLHDEKDRAENIMIADLMRNDLSKVCADHSVVTPEVCALRRLPHVHHLYSRVEGQLRPGLSALDAVAAAFPCGSITGAPKNEAMRIIAGLEGEGRGPYCGTVFAIYGDGTAVFSVAIRTGLVYAAPEGQRLDVRAGGGITILSDGPAEYDETLDKAYPFRAMTA